MQYLIISDLHGNLEALEAVLAAADGWDAVLVLGDLIGYGADPNAVVERVRALAPAAVIRGNHDKVGVGLAPVDGFNQVARQAITWTASVLTADNQAWLRGLPSGPVAVGALVEICHGAPFDEDAYVFDDLDAQRALQAAGRPICLYGHTHVPAVYGLDAAGFHRLGRPTGERYEVACDDGMVRLINCGAVGQPRDLDPRAAFGLLDTERRTVTVRRTPYDVAAAQAKILAAGLPPVLAQRLSVGR
jgi:diadenosine tetraphosphatase ApaH/serine/threonine PP2A family protein phosphatase